MLLAEHDEDMARLGGYLATTASARAASKERVPRRLWHRLPWLLIGLVGALLSAGVVGAFEETLERQVLLAFFVPGVVYLPITVWLWGDVRVAAAVALALFAACSIATVAMALPWLFDRLGRDRAYGSGPLATVVQDLLSILIYLVIAQALVS